MCVCVGLGARGERREKWESANQQRAEVSTYSHGYYENRVRKLIGKFLEMHCAMA